MTKLSIKSGRPQSLPDLLDNVSLHPSERAIARIYMREAELAADRLFKAGSILRSTVVKAVHGCQALAQQIKSSFTKLAHH
ncbi:MAG: hypothetical protein Q8K18_16720 [Burkholderiales bacterium]|nr:hypothetical protein [Burkholderiales bacterium]